MVSVATAALGLCMTAVTVGCSDARDVGAEKSNVDDADSIAGRLALSLPIGSNISSANYRVLSSENATLAAGVIDLSEAGASLSLDLILAPGTGDVVLLSAETSAGAACAGTSLPFDVTPGQPISVGLTLVCGGDQPSSSRCPSIQSWGVTPVGASVPVGTIDAGVVASSPEGSDPLSYVWMATAGTFLDASAADTRYVCTTAGPQTLTLTVRDDVSSPACAATASFLVSCVAGGSPPPSVVSVPILGR
ncbi:MAG TPA: hypothetical protein VFG23_06895 [Polyangia bacterium]|nr:hypothetical protein [Polyangia bacterium]